MLVPDRRKRFYNRQFMKINCFASSLVNIYPGDTLSLISFRSAERHAYIARFIASEMNIMAERKEDKGSSITGSGKTNNA
jgi:hypothetical protein